jgi:hypothetical protein
MANKKNLKRGHKFAEGKEIKDKRLYKHWSDLHRVQEAIANLKKDLERDCKAYYKYDELIQKIQRLKKQIKIEDDFQELK